MHMYNCVCCTTIIFAQRAACLHSLLQSRPSMRDNGLGFRHVDLETWACEPVQDRPSGREDMEWTAMTRDTLCDACAPANRVKSAPTSLELTYIRQSAVRAKADLWFIDVDENPWMAQRTPTSITGNRSPIYPSHRLLVYELDRGIWSWLSISSVGIHRSVTRTDLELHDCLLESGTGHADFSGLLILAPCARSIWCL